MENITVNGNCVLWVWKMSTMRVWSVLCHFDVVFISGNDLALFGCTRLWKIKTIVICSCNRKMFLFRAPNKYCHFHSKQKVYLINIEIKYICFFLLFATYLCQSIKCQNKYLDNNSMHKLSRWFLCFIFQFYIFLLYKKILIYLHIWKAIYVQRYVYDFFF